MSSTGRSSDASVQERRQRLLALVLERGDVEIRALAGELGVSAMTVHRDADALVAGQLIRKDRGRLSAPSKLRFQTAVAFRERTGQPVKEAIAACAMLDLDLATADAVVVDDSTTCLPLVQQLAGQDRKLTVVTNYVQAVRVAGGSGAVQVHLLGGRYVPELDAVFGGTTVESVGQWHFDLAVFSVPALTGGRLFHILSDSSQLKRAMIAASTRRVLLVDSSKFGRAAPHVICDAGLLDVVVTDDGAPEVELDALRERGVEVRVVPRQGE